VANDSRRKPQPRPHLVHLTFHHLALAPYAMPLLEWCVCSQRLPKVQSRSLCSLHKDLITSIRPHTQCMLLQFSCVLIFNTLSFDHQTSVIPITPQDVTFSTSFHPNHITVSSLYYIYIHPSFPTSTSLFLSPLQAIDAALSRTTIQSNKCCSFLRLFGHDIHFLFTSHFLPP
jgi:hypothetical protein